MKSPGTRWEAYDGKPDFETLGKFLVAQKHSNYSVWWLKKSCAD